ncbi:MAG: transposase family protein [Desulfuromonadales bacterium]|nr:transposase family protein [Desulfuromonadales bacterium]
MAIDPRMLDQVRRDWENALFGGKTEVIRKWAQLLGCTAQTLYQEMPTGRQRRGERVLPGIEEAALIVAQIKKRPPKDKGELATEDALRLALDNGEIPEEMRAIPVATFNRVMRDLGMDKRPRRVQRYQAERPNQLHHIDASSSECFYVARRLPDGDRVLKLHAGSGKGYKNKPVPTRERPWIYGLADDNSGYHLARYVAAQGESLVDNLDFLCWAWSKNEDKPFFGLPDRIKSDHGPLMKGKAANDFLDRLQIDVAPSIPGQKEAHGKIERPWRTMWQRFELPFFAESDWKGFEISLSELNRRFRIYQEAYNAKAHRFEKKLSRLDAWRRVSLHGGAVALPENALQTIARRWERTVEADGCLSLEGKRYEVKGLHCARVYVYAGVFDDRLVVVDQATGLKYEVEDFAPTPLDTFVGHPETPHQKAVKAAEGLQIRNTLYESPKDQGNLKAFPTRVKETRKIENPLAVDAYASLELAMQALTALSGEVFRDPIDREVVQKLLLQNGLSRKYVHDMASDFINARAGQKEVAQ